MFDYHVSIRGRDRFKISQRVKGLRGRDADERENLVSGRPEDYDNIHTPLLRVKDL